MINILIIDNDKQTAHSLKKFLSIEFNVINVYNSIELFLNKANPQLVPDIVILDIVLKGMNGASGIPHIKEFFPETNIVIYSTLKDDENIYKALSNGALGYITKDYKPEEIAEILKIIYAGGSYLSPVICRKILKFFKPQKNIFEELTNREKEIAESILKGLSYKMISLHYDISPVLCGFQKIQKKPL